MTAIDTTTLSAQVGTTLPAPIAVRVANASGAALSGVTVAWAVTSGGGTLSAASVVTDDSGTARVNWTLGSQPGPNSATATVHGISPVTFSAVARDDAPASMQRVGADSQQTWVGDSLVASPAVKVLTASGTPVVGVSVAWTVTAGGGRVALATSNTDTAGVARTSWTLGSTPGTNSLRAEAANLPSVSFTATALARVPVSLSLTRDSLRFNYWGDTSHVSVQALDVEGVVVDPGNITWSSSDTSVVTVNTSGKLTVVRGGSATITAVAGALRDTLGVDVQMPVLTIPFVDTSRVYNFSVVFGEDIKGPGQPLNPTWEIQMLGYGMAVHAVAGGKVVRIDTQSTTSDYEVYIEPLGTVEGAGREFWAMSYDHVINLAVAVGDTVVAGDSIGAVQKFDTFAGVGDIGRVELSVWYNLANGNADMMCPARLGVDAFNGIFDRLQKRLRPELSSNCLIQDEVLVPVPQGAPFRRPGALDP